MSNTKEHIAPPSGYFIHLQGRVQGIGFRPFVYQLAMRLELKGWVNNSVEGVKIAVYGEKIKLDTFYQKLLAEAPTLAKITNHICQNIDFEEFKEFSIIESQAEGNPTILLSPDFALCHNCKEELSDPQNRRKDYAFITCTQCGPRYSVLQNLPYDRETTSMQNFEMCKTCKQEYSNVHDRRYFSQTNSCPDCGIQMQVFDAAQNEIKFAHQTEIISFISKQLAAGKIIAVKGIGGYLLLTDASNEQSILTLRKRKNRPNKAFAVLYPNKVFLQEDVHLPADSLAHLENEASPIVLLPLKEKHSIASKVIAPNLDKIGVMLPYAPFLALLANHFQKPLIATSANISNAPIVYQDQEAIEKLNKIADFVLTHNREIMFPQDDSVIQLSEVHRLPIYLRRSRGYAPTFFYPILEDKNTSILATGAMLKSSFTLQHAGNLYVSQYLGDLESFDTQIHFQKNIENLLHLLKAKPSHILRDLHPHYPSTEWAESFATAKQISTQSIQHHEAHFGAVLAENHLLESHFPVLGFVWDGTGLGHDGNIWGGECFLYQDFSFSRIANIGEMPHILGDKMAREPRLSAFAFCKDITGAESVLKMLFKEIEWKNYSQILEKSTLKTTSVGRLFDAVAALLGLANTQSYEGEAAMYLEVLARKYFRENGLKPLKSYLDDSQKDNQNVAKTMLKNIIQDLKTGTDKIEIAAKFHYSLIDFIQKTAHHFELKHLAFSGGVFQNNLLVDLLIEFLSAQFNLCFHKQLSPNDECISLGQWACYQIEQAKNNTQYSQKNNLTKLCV
jgi:hydrogenase maturation protein HypF